MGSQKKVKRELELSCPDLFKSASSSLETALEQLKVKLLAEIEIFLNPEDLRAQAAYEKASKYLYDLALPDIINPHNPKSVSYTRDGTFEAICMSLEGRGVHDPGSLSVYQFYKRIEILNTQTPKK